MGPRSGHGIVGGVSKQPLVQVFMNERAGLVSRMVVCGCSQVENYTFGILLTVRFK